MCAVCLYSLKHAVLDEMCEQVCTIEIQPSLCVCAGAPLFALVELSITPVSAIMNAY